MTPKESAEAMEEFYTRWANNPNRDRQAMLDAFEKAFTEAMEEQREASAKILDEWALNERNRGENSRAKCAEFAASCVRNQTYKLVVLSSGLYSTATSMVISGGFTIIHESVRERIEKWLLNPIAEMRGSKGFLVLMVLIPLYERCLRQRLGTKGKGTFGDGRPVFDLIANDLQITANESARFWRGVRNMLLHWAGEEGKPPEHSRWGIKEIGPPIRFEKDEFWINPFALRDKLIEKILSNIDKWDHEFAFLPVTVSE